LEKEGVEKVLKELHDGPNCGHFYRNNTSHKILRVDYYWPTRIIDAHAYPKKCKLFQMCARKANKMVILL
jgi:hypothetical protein